MSIDSRERLTRLEIQTLPEFLIELYEYDPLDQSRDVFHEIGIHRYCDAVVISLVPFDVLRDISQPESNSTCMPGIADIEQTLSYLERICALG